MNGDAYPPIYKAYRAGIMVGSDEDGYFYPDYDISRTKAAAIIGRLIDPSQRKSITLTEYYITVYAMNGDTASVLADELDFYTLRGWMTSPYEGKAETIEQLLDEAPLTLVKTGYPPLDNLIDEIFDGIITDDMNTSEKVMACYDYLIDNCSYHSVNDTEDYIWILLNPNLCPNENGGYTRGQFEYGYITFLSKVRHLKIIILNLLKSLYNLIIWAFFYAKYREILT